MREHFPFQAAQSAIVDMLHDYLAEKEHAERLEAENARLKAEVERLRKAGDEMVFCINLNSPSSGNAIANWEAAKEGKPSV